MTIDAIRVSPQWLALREPADAAGRSADLVDHLAPHLPATGHVVIHDLGCGTGAMLRWLAPRLRGPQHWVLHDHDADLLEIAADVPTPTAATVETRRSDITGLPPREFAGATLITASALLDLLTAKELAGLIALGVAVACPMLLTLSVVGRVALMPADPLDARILAAFNDHQRRATGADRLLGPDAVATAVEGFRRSGAGVVVRPSPWRLGAAQADLAAAWLDGWLGAACEQDAELAGDAGAYMSVRLAQAAAGEFRVRVDHADLLVLPGRPGAS